MSGRESGWLPLWVTVGLAFGLWCVTFYLTWGTFWIKISLSAACLAGISLWLQPDRKRQLRWDRQAFVIGCVSAAALYLIFWAGKMISTALFPFADHQIGGIYGIGKGTPLWAIALMLFFVTGPSEEIYWRGYLQDTLMRRIGKNRGWLLSAAIYALVHLWSFNFMLIGAAGVAGIFWGGMYRYGGNLSAVIVSHAVWSCVIFAVLPVP